MMFRCTHCNYETRDSYTVEVINGMTGVCPQCGADAEIWGEFEVGGV